MHVIIREWRVPRSLNFNKKFSSSTPKKDQSFIFSLFKIYRIDIENRYVSADISVSRYGAKISIIDIPTDRQLRSQPSWFP